MNTRPGQQPARATDQLTDRPVRGYWGSMEPPKAKADFFSAVTSPTTEGGATVATIRMYGPIDSLGGWWGISTEDIGRVLDALPESVTEIVLRINSPGGEVWEAMAILNMLGAHRASVIAVVDGIAASAASFIAAGCEQTVMSRGSQMMLHSPSLITWGNAVEMRKSADFLDTLERSMIEVYTDKAGAQDWAAILAEETWLTAAEAVDLGLADRIAVVPDGGTASTVGVEDEDPAVTTVTVESDDDADARIHAAAARARATAIQLPSSSEPGTPNRKENVVTHDEEPQDGVNDRLGTTEAEHSEESVAAVPAAVTPPTTPTAALPEGIVAIDATVLAELQRNARQGADARVEQDRQRRDGIVATALQDGRITAASRDNFRALLDSDEAGTTATLASLAKNTVPVEEIGHQAAASIDADAYPAHWKR